MSLFMDLSVVRQQYGKEIPFSLQTTELPALSKEWLLQDTLIIEGNLSPHRFHIDLDGRIKASISGECSRCLKKLSYDLDIPVKAKLLFKQDTAQVEKPEFAFGELEEMYWIYDRFEYDFSYIVVEALLAHLPSRPLCDVDCVGLCPICGKNRNEGDCSCETAEIDPRWAGLAQSLNDEEV